MNHGTRMARFSPAPLLGLTLMLALTPRLPAQDPVPAEERITVIKARKIITVTGKDIAFGMIVLEGGKITNVGRGLEYPRNARVIDASDRVVMPGLIDVNTRFGLPRYERGGVLSQLTVADEFIPRPGMFDDLVESGFTAIALSPPGRGITGRALVTRTAGPEEQRTLTSPGYLWINTDKKSLREAFEKAQAEIDKVDKARKEHEEKLKKEAEAKPASAPAATQSAPASAPASQPAFQPPPIDPAFTTLVDLIQKKDGVSALLELGSASDVLQFQPLLAKYGFPHAFILRNGVQSDFFRVIEELGKQKSRIVAWPYVHRLPNSAERVHTLKDLAAAGCEVSLTPLNDSLYEHQVYLPRAAELAREGWAREDVLKALTLHPARLLGLEARFGAIEKDREADLIFLDNDPLKPGARVREVMIGGQIVYRAEELH